MKEVIVVGSGAGGATAAKELQGEVKVTVLEAGKEFSPFSFNLSWLEKLKKTGLFFDERLIQLLFFPMKIRKTEDKMVVVNGCGVGGTTTLAAANAIRADQDLKELGINLNPEFKELRKELPITSNHRHLWRETTEKLFTLCDELGLAPKEIDKLGDYAACQNCGRCVLGCPNEVKWDSRELLDAALEEGAKLVTGCRVKEVVVEGDKVKGVLARKGFKKKFYPADLVILAAGGLGTPVILQNSGFMCQDNLFVDPVLCVAAKLEGCLQNREIPMPFIVEGENFIIAPYFDYLSFFFNKQWRESGSDILGLMIKLADEKRGRVKNNRLNKQLTARDNKTLDQAVNLCRRILGELGIDEDKTFLGTVNAGHPGGMVPLTSKEAGTFHHQYLPENLYIADSSLIPNSLGKPPMLTIMAIAKRVSKFCLQQL